MPSFTHPAPRHRRVRAAAGALALAALLTACGSAGTAHDMAGMHHGSTPADAGSGGATPSSPSLHGAGDDVPDTDGADGLSDHRAGYRFAATATTLPAGTATGLDFSITGPDDRPVTAFAVEQTERMHLYAVRSDLTGFQHLHPVMAPDGTWRAPLAALTPGSWRVYTSFTPDSGAGKGTAMVLSRTVTVDGDATAEPLPAPAATAVADGYTVTVQGDPAALTGHGLTIGITRDGRPVTDLQPYLDAYAHLTAFHEGDAAFAHLHPVSRADGDHGGPDLSFHGEFGRSGLWRLFLQFRTAGQLHTAALTVRTG
ncbi:hypothetical protein KNE206_51890 [Kitasatospora sp. NE20-6]|uniref:hypothetical protein n=1 Tax=Kitasatospora sp. NE20-6 TaxID=2859066 RepID=UPI0034DCC4B1